MHATTHAHMTDRLADRIAESIATYGDGTWAWNGATLPESGIETGYLVGQGVPAETGEHGPAYVITDGMGPGRLREAVRVLLDHIVASGRDDLYVGSWFDTDADALVVEVSRHYDDETDARWDGRDRGETAIYDVARDECIYL